MNRPSPRLRTQRLELSAYEEGDLADVARIVGDPLVLWRRAAPLTEPEIRAFFDGALDEQRRGLG